MNNVIPFRGRITAATLPVCGAIVLAFRAKARATASGASIKASDAPVRSDRIEEHSGAIRGGLRASWHLNPDTARLECRWSLPGSGEELDASHPPCSKCAGVAVGAR